MPKILQIHGEDRCLNPQTSPEAQLLKVPNTDPHQVFGGFWMSRDEYLRVRCLPNINPPWGLYEMMAIDQFFHCKLKRANIANPIDRQRSKGSIIQSFQNPIATPWKLRDQPPVYRNDYYKYGMKLACFVSPVI